MFRYFGQALKITFQTLPYILLRLGIYLLFGVAFCLYWLFVYYVGQGAAAIHPNVRIVVWILAFILPFPFVRLFREYFLYVVKIGHVAVITQLALHGSLPDGVSQISWGKEKVMHRFKETSILFVVDRLVSGVIRSINGIMQGVGNVFSGVPGLSSLVGFAKIVVRFSLTYVDESVMARNFMKEEETVWQSAKSGVVLYAQSWQEVLKTALGLGLAAITSYGILAILFLIPFMGMSAAYPKLKFVFILFALIFAGVVKLALFDPWALTTMILVYINETKDKVPDRGWEEKLSGVSKKFRELQTKALAPAPATPPVASQAPA